MEPNTTHDAKPHHLEKRLNEKKKKSNVLKKQAVEIKREAILEERRNRLGRNFEKVKRIAHEMKARQEDKINLLSKSMALAETNRNRHIEKRRAASKQTVERAKYIALQNQYRSQQEQERRRAELESRFEKTEQRRLAHLNQKQKQRKQSPIVSLVAPMSSVTITTQPIIVVEQPKKKLSAWAMLREAFYELKLPLPSNKDTWLEFNALGKLLNQAKVIVVTTKVLNTALKLNDEESRPRGRVLLTSYMTLMCPKEVLQNIQGDEEKRLHSAAVQMLNLFETWLKAHGRPGATTARLAFVEAWNEYYILFEAWKANDCDQLIQGTIVYYVELSTLRQTMIAQQQDDPSVGEQLQVQLDGIKKRLEKLGGTQALTQLQRALESSASSTSTGRKKQQQNNTPRTPQEVDNTFEQEKYAHQGQYMGQLLNGYLPESGLTNDQLAHELIMDPEFKLKRHQPTDDLESRVKMMTEKAFFDKVAEEIEQGHPELSLTSLIMDVKTRLLALVRPGTAMYNSMDEAIDLALVQQQLQQNTFDIQGLMNYVIDIMSKMCAPVRDVEMQALKANTNLIDQIRQTLNLLEDMSLDLANFQLRSLRPHLMSMAVEYEREKFAALLNSGQIQLVRTSSWLSQSANKLCQTAAQRNPEGGQPTSNKPTHDAVFEDAYVALLVQPQLIDSVQVLPETLSLDAKRMAVFQNEVQAITMVASLLMLAKNFGSTNPHALSQLGNTLFTMLEDPATSIDHLSTEIERAVHMRPERRDMVRSMVDKTMSHTDTVYSLLSRRVATVIKSTIQNNTFVTDAVLASNGLQHVKSHLQSISLQILRMTHHHRKVYASYYDEIITKALQEHMIVSSSNA